MLGQAGLREIMRRIDEATLCVLGIGATDAAGTLALGTDGEDDDAQETLRSLGVVAELLPGQFLDADGRLVSTPWDGRMMAPSLDSLAGREVVAVAGGRHKRAAIAAALASGHLSGLITDESTARALVRDRRRGDGTPRREVTASTGGPEREGPETEEREREASERRGAFTQRPVTSRPRPARKPPLGNHRARRHTTPTRRESQEMGNRERDLVSAFLAGKMSRRSLIKRLGALGVGAGASGSLMGLMSSRALAQDFDWQKHSGAGIKLLLNKHPYTDAMIANLDAFKEMTGMEVTYDVFPEDVYFDKVTAALSSGSSEYDAFMTGAYMTWTYGPAGWITDLNEWIQDPEKTAPGYDFEDMLPGLRSSTAWDGVPGSELGGEGAKQWCIPWGFEANNLAYNRNMFEQIGAQPPTNMDELMEVAKRCNDEIDGAYGIGVRGSRSWATIHPGFLSAYANFGEKDLMSDGGTMKAAMNTDGSKAFHRQWVKMIQDSGPRDWSSYTWYQVGTDIGAGTSAMIYDADILGYFFNGGDNKEAGNLGFAPFAANPEAPAPTPNIWIWSLAMANRLREEGRGVVLHSVGLRRRARAVRRARDGLRQPRPPVGLGGRDVSRAHRAELPRLHRAVQGVGARLADLLHPAAAVLRPDHRVGGLAAEDGGERGADRRRARSARREHRSSTRGGRPRLKGGARGDAAGGGTRVIVPSSSPALSRVRVDRCRCASPPRIDACRHVLPNVALA